MTPRDVSNLMLDLSVATEEVLDAHRRKVDADRSLLSAQMRLSAAKDAISRALNAAAGDTEGGR